MASGIDQTDGIGNGMVTVDAYDVGERLTSEQVTLPGVSAPLVDTSYGWSGISANELQSRTEAGGDLGSGITSVTDHYAYDSLHELIRDVVQQNGATSYTQSYGYNLSSKGTADGTYRIVSSPAGTYAYGYSAHPNAVSSISTQGGGYVDTTIDGDGEITSDFNGGTDTYISFDMALAINNSIGTTTQLYYDADHRRVREVYTDANGIATTTDYLSDGRVEAERVANPDGSFNWRDYIAGPYGLIGSAWGTAGQPYVWLFSHGDHHGSVGTTTNGQGGLYPCQGYEAFGKRRFCTGATDPNNTITTPAGSTKGFLAQEEMDTSGLVNLGARLYDPHAGLFLTPDPAGLKGGPAPYAYAGNDPTDYADPTGLIGCPSDTVCVQAPKQDPFPGYTVDITYNASGSGGGSTARLVSLPTQRDAFAQAIREAANTPGLKPTGTTPSSSAAPPSTPAGVTGQVLSPSYVVDVSVGQAGFIGGRASNRSEKPKTDIVLGYEHPGGLVGYFAYHTYLEAIGSNNERFFIRGGPTTSSLLFGGTGALGGLNGNINPMFNGGYGNILVSIGQDAIAADQPDTDTVAFQNIGSINMKFDTVVQILTAYGNGINAAGIPYNPVSSNSNSISTSAAMYLGLNVPQPLRGYLAPGYLSGNIFRPGL